MNKTQPNARYRSPSDLNERDREHFDVASAINGWFDKAKFVNSYARQFPHRNPGSIIPSDYCFNRDNKGNASHPRFLEWDGNKNYCFVGMGTAGQAPTPNGAQNAIAPPSAKWTTRSQGQGFRPQSGRPLLLDPTTARAAIVSYNSSLSVQAQERSAFAALGSGFTQGQIERQLRALDQAYSTRSVHGDLAIIANGIESRFAEWQALAEEASPLHLSVTSITAITKQLSFFLETATRRKPRSLATKALHFAAPCAFLPADAYAANLIGQELGCGPWAATSGLDCSQMASWFHDYLEVARRIADQNQQLVTDLLALDVQSNSTPGADRVRGWPKILDKILWWNGQPGSEAPRLFQRS